MAGDDLTSRVNGVFQKVFGDETLIVSRVTTAQDVEGWDSLMHINLIVAIEREFKVRFTTRDITGLKNVGELMDLVVRKTVPSS
jgi:acyl carrier protein